MTVWETSVTLDNTLTVTQTHVYVDNTLTVTVMHVYVDSDKTRIRLLRCEATLLALCRPVTVRLRLTLVDGPADIDTGRDCLLSLSLVLSRRSTAFSVRNS